MKVFFTITAVLMLLLGLAWTLAPSQMLTSWGLATDEATVYVARRQGGLFFGYCAMFLLARKADRSAARSAILGGGLVVTLVMAALGIYGMVSGVVGSGVVLPTGIELVLASCFAWFLFAPEKKAAQIGSTPAAS